MSEITKDLLIKVPAVTLGFWIIKILAVIAIIIYTLPQKAAEKSH